MKSYTVTARNRKELQARRLGWPLDLWICHRGPIHHELWLELGLGLRLELWLGGGWTCGCCYVAVMLSTSLGMSATSRGFHDT